MIRLYSNKNGAIYISNDLLRNSILKIILIYINKSGIIDIEFDTKKNQLKFTNIKLKKTVSINEFEEKNIHDEIKFFLSNKFQLSNVIVTFFYESF